MVQNTALTNETICDLSGQPLDRRAASLLKAIDTLLTVGAYYSADHDQYRLVSEKTCRQIVEAIGPDKAMAIEITAAGMMIRSQLVDPHHRNVRLLHDLLVPLNIARFEICLGLTPADLRQAVTALQLHKQNLGNTEGFQEIKIENLPDTVNTASRKVVRDTGDRPAGRSLSLDQFFGSDNPETGRLDDDILMPESEKLAREFLEVVNRILANLEKGELESDHQESSLHPESSPENIRALREALQRLVEVNPDPGDLARLIEHAKRALDLSRDPNSVDLVFSLLKTEADKGGDWKYKARDKNRNKPQPEFKLSVDQLRKSIVDLEKECGPPDAPVPTARANFLGICFHLLGTDPSEAQAKTLVDNLARALTDRDLTLQDLNLCSSAVITSAHMNHQATLDRVLSAFTVPLRAHKPEYLVRFWLQIWESLDPGRRALAWPHLVSDLLLGLENTSPEAVEKMWLAAGELDSKIAITQVARLDSTAALGQKVICPVLMSLPLVQMYPVHMVLMKSSQALVHGARLHDHLRRQPLNGLTEILMKVLGEYDPVHDTFYLSLIKQSGGETITPDLRRMSARLICEALMGMESKSRTDGWVLRAIGWLGKLDPVFALPVLARIRDEKKFFFFKAWPEECREAAQAIMASTPEPAPMKDER
jgi:hypothetical protein